jgi:hypothetical protein
MKNTIFIALILLAGILTSCGSVKYFGIETFTPAEITFPETVETVVIVNNAVPQPKKPGYKYTIMGVEQDTTHMVADSALYDACKALGEAIADQPFLKTYVCTTMPCARTNFSSRIPNLLPIR